MNTPLYYGSVGIFGASHLPRRVWPGGGVGRRLAALLVSPFKRSGKPGRSRVHCGLARPESFASTGGDGPASASDAR